MPSDNRHRVSSTKTAPDKALIAAFYARGLIDYLRARGVDPAQLLPAQKVMALDRALGNVEVSLADWVAMVDAAIAALGEPALPAEAGASRHLKHPVGQPHDDQGQRGDARSTARLVNGSDSSSVRRIGETGAAG